MANSGRQQQDRRSSIVPSAKSIAAATASVAMIRRFNAKTSAKGTSAITPARQSKVPWAGTCRRTGPACSSATRANSTWRANHSARFAITPTERHTRAELIAVGNAYLEAVERNTGEDYYPFTDDCLRLENGIIAAAPEGHHLADRPSFGQVQTCKGQLETSLIGAVTSIRDRRFVAVDQERGIVFAFAFFDHRPINWSWQLGELFKIEDGLISRIEAIFIRGPYGMCSGWSTYNQCRSEDTQDVR